LTMVAASAAKRIQTIESRAVSKNLHSVSVVVIDFKRRVAKSGSPPAKKNSEPYPYRLFERFGCWQEQRWSSVHDGPVGGARAPSSPMHPPVPPAPAAPPAPSPTGCPAPSTARRRGGAWARWSMLGCARPGRTLSPFGPHATPHAPPHRPPPPEPPHTAGAAAAAPPPPRIDNEMKGTCPEPRGSDGRGCGCCRCDCRSSAAVATPPSPRTRPSRRSARRRRGGRRRRCHGRRRLVPRRPALVRSELCMWSGLWMCTGAGESACFHFVNALTFVFMSLTKRPLSTRDWRGVLGADSFGLDNGTHP
jgi:hypothetical protein